MSDYFIKMLKRLRTYEELVLYDNLPEAEMPEAQEAIAFLEQEYKRECADYPLPLEPFDAQAALWAARTVYTTAQLMLYRQNKPAELNKLLTAYTGEVTAAAMLCADITLRFVVPMLRHLTAIDPADKLIPVVEQLLHTWHYSGIGHDVAHQTLLFDAVEKSACLQQMYVNRIIEARDVKRAAIPAVNAAVKAAMGNYRNEYWKDFDLLVKTEP